MIDSKSFVFSFIYLLVLLLVLSFLVQWARRRVRPTKRRTYDMLVFGGLITLAAFFVSVRPPLPQAYYMLCVAILPVVMWPLANTLPF